MARMYHYDYSNVHLLSESLSFRFISTICFGRYIICSVHIFSQLVVFLESCRSLIFIAVNRNDFFTYSPIIATTVTSHAKYRIWCGFQVGFTSRPFIDSQVVLEINIK